MKKLTPFQKKVARWTGSDQVISWADGIALFIVVICLFVAAVNFKNNKNWPVDLAVGICVIATLFTAIVLNSINDFWRRLSETQVEIAKKFVEANPKYEKIIDELIQEAFVQDDGGELKEALEKFEILAGKEKSLAGLPHQAEKLKTEIAALEKELGL